MIHLAGTRSLSTLSDFDQVQVQPNAIDLRIDKLFEMFSQTFVICEDDKRHRETKEIKPVKSYRRFKAIEDSSNLGSDSLA